MSYVDFDRQHKSHEYANKYLLLDKIHPQDIRIYLKLLFVLKKSKSGRISL